MNTEPISKPDESKRTFVSRQKRVFDSFGNFVALAQSTTMARRIANALNRYVPGPRGY